MKVDFDDASGTILLSRSDIKEKISVTDAVYSNKSQTPNVSRVNLFAYEISYFFI